MSCCYIVGPMNFNVDAFDKKDGDLIIAADAGLLNLKKHKIKPDYIIGDFDSLGETPNFENVISYPTEKDDTDLFLAVKKALDLGFKIIKIYGALGGRVDHSFANLQILNFIRENNAHGFIISEKEIITIIEKEKILFEKNCRGLISIFSFTEKATGVTVDGLKYNLKNAKLTQSVPIGVSNEFQNRASTICVKEGRLLITFPVSCNFQIKTN
ncbi:MAG: thiamine diphosphokinase [Clostridia bacterium]|nr:thiamine diphosphokinase [Clostridia bacterium]